MAPNCIVPNTIGATNGKSSPLKYGTAILVNIANSITDISNNGNVYDFSTNNIINNMHIIDELFTLLKSVSLIFTKSFISGPSPAKIPSLSYFVIIL